MAAVGFTSPPAPSAFAPAASPCSHSSHPIPHLRFRSLPVRLAAAASFRARCAAAAANGGAAASEGNAAVAEVEGDPSAGTDVAGGAATSTRPPYSLISADNVQKAMRGLAITDADHYGRLGVTKLASTDEVKAAYEKKCEELNSKGLEEEEINKEHDLLKESFTVLSTEEERRLYDWSLSRSGQPERYVWPFEVDPLELAPDPPKVCISLEQMVFMWLAYFDNSNSLIRSKMIVRHGYFQKFCKLFRAKYEETAKELYNGFSRAYESQNEYKEPEDEFPTKLVGYFFLAWFILSVAFSVTLNR